jgi:hypothetical protein
MAPHQGTTVGIGPLQDFHATLTARLSEVNSVLTTLQSDPVLVDSAGTVRSPKLGAFSDAGINSSKYTSLYLQYLQRIQRLHNAITAVQSATQKILENYHTTEQLNAASANDVNDALTGVDSALQGA